MIQIPRLHIWIYLLLALPLLFLRVNNSHDWGDDFAQYILQSKYLTGEVTELPVSETGTHGPRVKGILFSVLLSPAILFTDASEIVAGKIMVSLTLILLGLALLLFFKRHFGEFNATVLALAVVYNFQFVRIKDQILPDFLLAALVICSLLLFLSSTPKEFYFGLLLAGLSVGIKSSGIALVLTSTLCIVFFKHNLIKTNKDKLSSLAILAMPVLIIYLIEILLTSAKPSVMWYSIVTVKNAGFSILVENFIAYKTGFYSLLEFEVPMIYNLVIKWCCVLLFLFGFGYRVIKNFGWPELFLMIYFVFLLFYPYSKDPVRFLVPAFPLILYFIIYALQLLMHQARIKHAFFFGMILLAVLTIQTLRLELQRNIQYPTENASSRELFRFLNTNVKPGELVADTKPWAISYYTDVKSVPFEAAYLSDYRIIRLDGNNSIPVNVLSNDSKVFENKAFIVVRKTAN